MREKLTKELITQIEDRIGYEFNNKHLLNQAFTRKSYTEENGGENNEVLEFIGDKGLDIVVIKKMMESFGKFKLVNDECNLLKEEGPFITTYDEGGFTEIKKNLVDKEALSKFMNNLGFNEYLIMGNGDIERHIEDQPSVKEDLFEAIIGAVALDSKFNIDSIYKVCSNMIDFNSYFGIQNIDGKTFYEILSNSLKQFNMNAAKYEIIKENENFICKLNFDGTERNFYGEGKTEEIALNRASYLANDYLLNEDNYIETLQDAIGYPSFEECIIRTNELNQKQLINDLNFNYKEIKDQNGNAIWNCNLKIKEYDRSFSSYSRSKVLARKIACYFLIDHIFEDNIEFEYFEYKPKEMTYQDYHRLREYQIHFFHITEALELYGINSDETLVYKEKMKILYEYYLSNKYLEDLKKYKIVNKKCGFVFTMLEDNNLDKLFKYLLSIK